MDLVEHLRRRRNTGEASKTVGWGASVEMMDWLFHKTALSNVLSRSGNPLVIGVTDNIEFPFNCVVKDVQKNMIVWFSR